MEEISGLIIKTTEFFSGDPKRIQHFIKVHTFARVIGRAEGLDIRAMHCLDVASVVHGSWIPLLESEISGWNPEFAGKDPIGGYMCSVCKEEAIYDCNDEFVLSKLCPYCGAKMDKN